MIIPGDKFRIKKVIWTGDGLREKTVDAVVKYAPSHERFVSFWLSFRGMFGALNEYGESYMMDDLKKMAKAGKLRRIK